MEHRLSGGRNDGAVRVGRTVRRRAGTQTPAVHALLRHLEAVGFTGAPRALGIDDRGREVLTYLDGDTVGDARPWPAWTRSDVALIAVGRWLREFHAASRSFVPPAGAQWFGDHNDLRPAELIGHHDAAPYNAVWRALPTESDPSYGELVGLIDWDLAGPAKPDAFSCRRALCRDRATGWVLTGWRRWAVDPEVSRSSLSHPSEHHLREDRL